MNFFSSKNISTAISTIVFVAILGGVYWYFFGGVGAPAAPLTQTSATGESADVFALTSQLTNVSFDTSIFSDPRFASLQNISTPVTPEPEGKTDPFSPL